ncbi:DUF167 domain-containing protein [archaeon]|nr:DUF167 domain-containing protein [archaeon]
MEINFPLEVKVKPNCSKNEIILKNNQYVVSIKAKPEYNKANIELIKFISKLTGKQIRIIKGLKSRIKVLDEK